MTNESTRFAERYNYATMVVQRLQAAVIKDSPMGVGGISEFWDALSPLDEMIMRRVMDYEEGRISKQDLVDAGAAYLHQLRTQVLPSLTKE